MLHAKNGWPAKRFRGGSGDRTIGYAIYEVEVLALGQKRKTVKRKICRVSLPKGMLVALAAQRRAALSPA